MANNRMFILCKKCGDAFCIGKTMDTGYYGIEYQEFGYELREFYDKHDCCGDSFKLVYESADNPDEEITNEQWEAWAKEADEKRHKKDGKSSNGSAFSAIRDAADKMTQEMKNALIEELKKERG